MSGPKPDALPLGDTPLHNFTYHSIGIWVGVKGVGDIKWLVLLRGWKRGVRDGECGGMGRTKFPHYSGGHHIDYVHHDRLGFWQSIITFAKEN